MNEDKASRYHRLRRRTVAVSVAIRVVCFGALLLGGLSIRFRDAGMAIGGGSSSSASTVAVYVLLLGGVLGVLFFVPAFFEGYVLERRYGLSSESPGAFLRDSLKAMLLNLLLALGASQILYGSMRLTPDRWWLVSAAVLTAALAALSALTPVVLLPLFYRFRPLQRPELRDRLTRLSQRAGIAVLGVYEWGLGDTTRRANAALVGSGRTRRVLVSDTLLAEYSDDEIEVILAHELGHHAYRDLATIVVVQAVVIAAALGASAVALRLVWRVLGLTGPADVAGLPVVLLAGGAVALLATPATNLLSRHHERRADRYALALTQRPGAFVSALRRLGAQNLAESNPSPLVLWLFHSHPPVEQRIAAARAFERAGTVG